jgi:hypothetical protein
MEEHLPNMLKILDSIPSTAKLNNRNLCTTVLSTYVSLITLVIAQACMAAWKLAFFGGEGGQTSRIQG